VTHLLAAAGGDPLLNGDVDLAVVLIVAFKVLVAFAVLLIGVMLMIWFERKLIADMQNRIGPNVAGPWGVLQTLADGVKLFFKEDLLPERADLFVFRLAPLLAMVPAFVTFCVVPLGGVFQNGNDGIVHIFGHDTYLQVADPPIGILLVLAMSSIAVYGVMLAGWSSGSKYPLIGSVRASAQMVSYEAALGLAVATVVLVSHTLSTHGMVTVQDRFVNWNFIATGVVPFVVFLIAATAELNRPPFDLVEAEQEIVGGYNTEYASIRFALFYIAEFMNVVTMSAIIVTLFFGGPRGPLLFGPDWIWPTIWFFLKVLVFIFVYVWFRATLPRLRYDQLMDLGWKTLIPLAFGWLLIISLLRLAQDHNWNVALAAVCGFAVGGLCWVLLAAAIAVAKRNRVEAGESF
jgi:NADH-quinone oxidoreductase subunit H